MNTIEKKFKKGGVILAPPNKEDAIYEQVFGAEAPQEPFNWEPYLPIFERQGNTTGCVSFARLNCAETLAKKDGLDFNLSDRHLFVISGTTKSGNNLNAVAEAFRTLGVVREEYFSWKPEYLQDQSAYWQEIFDTSSIASDARRYLGGNHSWVEGKEAMKSALAFSPLQIAFAVGETYNDEIVKPPKQVLSYHSTMFYWIDKEGNYYIFDSADGERKILDKDYKIMQCKSYRDLPENWKLSLQQIEEKKIGILQKILEIIKKILGLLKEEAKLIPPAPVPVPPAPPLAPIEALKYPFGTVEEAKKSVKLICEEEGLSADWTTKLLATVNHESGFYPRAEHINADGTKDCGIAQFSTNYYQKEYKITCEECKQQPERCIRIMARNFKNGRAKNWNSYKYLYPNG